MVRCPRCRQEAARRSRRVGVGDHLLGVLHLYPFRCQLCTTRFRAFQGRRYSEHGERREYDRLFVRVPVMLAGGGTQAVGETVDVSSTGCTVRADVVYPAGATVELRLRLGQAGDVEVQAAVVRSQGEGRLGLEFARMARPERERLGRYLARFLRPSGTSPRRARPRPQLVLAAAVGLAVILVVLMLVGRLGGPPVR